MGKKRWYTLPTSAYKISSASRMRVYEMPLSKNYVDVKNMMCVVSELHLAPGWWNLIMPMNSHKFLGLLDFREEEEEWWDSPKYHPLVAPK